MKYSYSDWHKGAVTIRTTYSQNIEGQPKIQFVDLKEFSEIDQRKIEKEQKRIFESIVTKNLEDLKTQFVLRYNKTEFKFELLNDEIKQVYDLLFSPIQDHKSQYVYLSFWQKIYDRYYVEQIQSLIHKFYINCQPFDFSFVNSEKSPYLSELQPIEIQTAKYFRYYKWLEKTIEEANAPKFNLNQLNELTFQFINFLNDNFEPKKKTKPRFAKMYHFLKNEFDPLYFFKMSQAEYKAFVLRSFNVDIQKATLNKPFNYEKDSIILQNLQRSFAQQELLNKK